MNEERVGSVNEQNGGDHTGRKADDRQNRPESRPEHGLENRDPGRNRVVEVLALVVHNVYTPEQAHLVPQPVIPVPHKVGGYKQGDPQEYAGPYLNQGKVPVQVSVHKIKQTNRKRIQKPLGDPNTKIDNGTVELIKTALLAVTGNQVFYSNEKQKERNGKRQVMSRHERRNQKNDDELTGNGQHGFPRILAVDILQLTNQVVDFRKRVVFAERKPYVFRSGGLCQCLEHMRPLVVQV